MNHIYIQPTDDFTKRTMTRLMNAVRRQKLIRELILLGLATSPLIVRAVWLLLRGDYFAVAGWPMSAYLLRAYQFFLSPSAIYTFSVFASMMAVIFLVKSARHNLLFQRTMR